MAAQLAACGGLPEVRLQLGAGDAQAAREFPILIAADEPEAVLVARNVLLAGGNAADAAVTLAFSLTVTLPSSAGLGGSGACMVHAARGATELVTFAAKAPSGDGARFRAGVPALPRGLFALHAKYGRVPWAQVVVPAENLARFGHPVSRALANDLATSGDVLAGDSVALATFMTPRRQILRAGDVFKQLDLAAVLARIRARGAGDFYTGALARDVEEAAAVGGSAVALADLRDVVPQWSAVVANDDAPLRTFTFTTQGGGAPDDTAAGATGFVVADPQGNAVACALSMGKPFGLGIMPKGTGFLLAPSPDAPGLMPASLTAIIGVTRPQNMLASAAAGFGSHRQAPAKGLINMLGCSMSEDAPSQTCEARNDPRGAGYAIVLNPKE